MTNEEAIKILQGEREGLLKILDNVHYERQHTLVALDMAIEALERQGKAAEWYDEDGCKGACEGYMSAGVICSQCGEVFCGYIGDYDFCPNCGWRMKEGK